MICAGTKLSRLRRRLNEALRQGPNDENRLTVAYAARALAERTPAKYSGQRLLFGVIAEWARRDYAMELRVSRVETQAKASAARLAAVVERISAARERGDQLTALALTFNEELEARQAHDEWNSRLARARRVL
jgi:hypothetical protein